ncbi:MULTISPECIES: DUF6119 family protein [Rhodococcus]|uniref:DUF6119 family protein n=1 Tax=Rhodococcus TaxID=1827 RepID=UPI0015D51249|nr:MULTISPECIES: DUF6119 family protein [Rhodococcus]
MIHTSLIESRMHLAQRRSTSAPTTLYRLTGLEGKIHAIKEKYLGDSEGFETRECSVGDREALLVHGHISTEQPKWTERVGSLIEEPIVAKNVTAAAVLLIDAGDSVTWAITYGMGFLLLDQAHVDPGFGQRLAIRIADPEKLNSLTRKTMDDRAKIDRSSIPSGAHLRGFGIGGFGELVTRVVAAAELSGLSVGKPFKLRGADALSMPLGLSPKTLLTDLAMIEEALARPAQKDLEVLEQLVAVKKGSDSALLLDTMLVKALSADSVEGFGSAWPHESVNENGTPDSFVVKGRGRRDVRAGVPTAEDIKESVDKNNILDSLDRVKIQLFSDPDGQEAISSDIPLRKWIAYETTLAGRRYFLHDGAWYLMDDAYAADLAKRVQEIFDRNWQGELPPWPPDREDEKIEEKHYNKLAADACGGVLLDRKLIYTLQNRRGFETCDILTSDGDLVHVKNIDSSAPASHLFAQGHNSAHSLMSDNQARTKFKKRVEDAGGDPHLVKKKPPAVVFGIARRKGKLFTAETLYSFSQVTLVRTVNDLESRGIDVYIVPILNGAAPETAEA